MTLKAQPNVVLVLSKHWSLEIRTSEDKIQLVSSMISPIFFQKIATDPQRGSCFDTFVLSVFTYLDESRLPLPKF
jgi:hypothetical protein